MKKIALLGSTGSIGRTTLQIALHLSSTVEVAALAAYSNVELLAQQIALFHPPIACIYQEEGAAILRERFPSVRIVSGDEGLQEIVTSSGIDFVVMAIVGMHALRPTIQAIEAGKIVALASKEVLVAAGEYISNLVQQKGIPLLPIDSEHSAIFQCIEGRSLPDIRRVILTASGGPFRQYDRERLAQVTVEEALAHPTWSMGPKVTIDCSTLVNKGLELIEARWLFNIPPEKLSVVIHPQSVVHSFVEFMDGILLSQIHAPSMTYPIQYALTYPKREVGIFPPFDFAQYSCFSFFSPDIERFPGLHLAQESLRMGCSTPTYFNAANEVLVERFLHREISWCAITQLLEKLLYRHKKIPLASLEAILYVDQEARKEARIA